MNHNFPFDPTYGYDLPKLLQVGSPNPPDDFEAFWKERYTATLAIPPNPSVRQITSNAPGLNTHEIEYDSLAGFRVGGWLQVPRDVPITRGIVVGHGYGGRSEAGGAVPGPPAAAIYPCGRGFNRSARKDLPDTSAWHVLHGIDSREKYIHGFCAADLWAAVSTLLELFPTIQTIDYLGVSFGGGIGALAVPWEPRFRRAALEVPSFGNHPLRVTLPCTGSGEAVRLMYRRRPNVLDVLKYFDAATAVRFAKIPVMVGAALFDPAVPPPGQFAVYNAIASKKELFVEQANHFAFPGESEQSAAFFQQADAWLG